MSDKTTVQTEPDDCPRGADRPEPSCTNRHQCWEPCGELGKSAEHVRVGKEHNLHAKLRESSEPAAPYLMTAVACGGLELLDAKTVAMSEEDLARFAQCVAYGARVPLEPSSQRINELAREAGLPMSWLDTGKASAWPELERFARLVSATGVAAPPAEEILHRLIAWDDSGEAADYVSADATDSLSDITKAARAHVSGVASLDRLDSPLPCAVSVDGATFGKGVPLRTLVAAATRWRREAFGAPLSDEEKAANLARLTQAADMR